MTTPLDYASPDAGTLQRQAWVWLRRLHSGDVRSRDAEAFKRWLAASPAHKKAFQEARMEWDLLGPAAGQALADPEVAWRHREAMRGPRPNLRRRAFVGAAAAAVAGVAVFRPPAGLWPAPGEWNADYSTSTGEQRTVALESGVNLTLNTQTRVRRETQDEALAAISVLTGEAAVDLGQRQDPFIVLAGAGRSMAASGHFQVRNLDGRVCVSCLEGAVRVEHPAGTRELRGRQQVIYDATALSAIASVDPAVQGAWREGKLVFERTPLAQVITEINRYRPGRVMLMNASAGRQPVSGSFDITLLDMALAQLERTFELSAQPLGAGLLVLT